MKTAELLRGGLEIDERWQVVDVSYDAALRQFDVRVGEPAGREGWFSRPRPAVSASEKHVWRHVNIGTRRCFIHLALTPGQVPPDQPWSGERDMPFTHALGRHIALLLLQGINLQTICTLLDIALADLWKFKCSLDSGKARLSSVPAPVQPSLAEAGVVRGANGAVPETSDPVWERLLDGSLDIDIRFLSLKLLLTKLREQMRVIEDSDVRMLKVCEIQRYFERNEPRLKHELMQLVGGEN